MSQLGQYGPRNGLEIVGMKRRAATCHRGRLDAHLRKGELPRLGSARCCAFRTRDCRVTEVKVSPPETRRDVPAGRAGMDRDDGR
jgi:hypothetical protein